MAINILVWNDSNKPIRAERIGIAYPDGYKYLSSPGCVISETTPFNEDRELRNPLDNTQDIIEFGKYALFIETDLGEIRWLSNKLEVYRKIGRFGKE